MPGRGGAVGGRGGAARTAVRRGAAGAVVLVALTSLGACWDGVSTSTPPPTQPPAQIVIPTHGRDCGDFTLGQGGSIPDEASKCISAAFASGEAAHLKVTSPTVEGDPVPVTYQVVGVEELDVYHDLRADTFGADAVTRARCWELSFPGQRPHAGRCGPPVEL